MRNLFGNPENHAEAIAKFHELPAYLCAALVRFPVAHDPSGE
jgi:hypothetical protein